MYKKEKQIKMLKNNVQRWIDNFPLDKNKPYIDQCKELFEKYPDSFSTILKCGYTLYEIDHQYIPPFKYLVDWINEQTPLLQDSIYGFSTKLYWIFNNIIDFPECANTNCHNKIGIEHNVKINRGYPQYCCNKCAQKAEETIAKTKATKFKNHGDPNWNNIEKNRQTCKEHFGVEYAWQSPEIIDKCKKTRQRHIKEDPNYLKNINEKTNNTIAKHIKENPNYWNDRIQKIKQTNIRNGHESNWVNSKKAKETIQKHKEQDPFYQDKINDKIRSTKQKHKEEDPFYQDKIIVKIKATKKKNHGDENYVNVEKCRQTKLKNHGDPNWNNSKKNMQTCLERYGTPMYMPYGSQKFKNRMVELYGVEHNSQCHELRIKQRQKYLYDNQLFGSSWEIAFYIWLKDNHINFIFQPNVNIWYEFNNKMHKYEPDFMVDNKLIEIKGDHFFKEDGTMKCPYRKKSWTDEQYLQKCLQYEAKHQCMIENNVIILKQKDCQKYIDYVEQTYGKGYLQQFKKKQKESKI